MRESVSSKNWTDFLSIIDPIIPMVLLSLHKKRNRIELIQTDKVFIMYSCSTRVDEVIAKAAEIRHYFSQKSNYTIFSELFSKKMTDCGGSVSILVYIK